MNLRGKLKREPRIAALIRAGYSRKRACEWYNMIQKDGSYYGDTHSSKELHTIHQAGFLCKTVQRYQIMDVNNTEYISDLDYMAMKPFNNSFEKWVGDIITTERVLKGHADVCRKTYFSIIQRDGEQLILPLNGGDKEVTVEDLAAFLLEKGTLELRPSHWTSKGKRYLLSAEGDKIFINGKEKGLGSLRSTVRSLKAAYVVCDPVDLFYRRIEGVPYDHYIKLWMANDAAETPRVLTAVMYLYSGSTEDNDRKTDRCLIDVESGTYELDGVEHTIDNWQSVLDKACAISGDIRQLDYFTMSVALQSDSLFKIIHFNTQPYLPEICYNKELNDYLRQKSAAAKKPGQSPVKTLVRAVMGKIRRWLVKKVSRRGIREYMQEMWMKAVLDDALHTKGVSLSKKIWAWKRGFLSFRLWQYGLTEENYKNFLSDYDYYWLNRINNVYQKWINDKTTYRLVMEPMKQYLPEYYFSVFARNGKMTLCRMPDCPADIPESADGVLTLLERKGKLAFKASAGTHGDGFYCLGYEDGVYTLNGKPVQREEMVSVLSSQKSFYIITEYLSMHKELKKIYDKSVNTVRIMVINEHGYDPKIMQTYMRIGSSKTGFTDNVGYGGICTMVEKETGRLYMPQTIKSHVFYDCPVHPDTGTEIAGYLPEWDQVRKAVLDVARYLCELEYLGFDVAITDKGIEILEINIHQDLHKVADFTDEIKEFFRRKKENKLRINM